MLIYEDRIIIKSIYFEPARLDLQDDTKKCIFTLISPYTFCLKRNFGFVIKSSYIIYNKKQFKKDKTTNGNLEKKIHKKNSLSKDTILFLSLSLIFRIDFKLYTIGKVHG